MQSTVSILYIICSSNGLHSNMQSTIVILSPQQLHIQSAVAWFSSNSSLEVATPLPVYLSCTSFIMHYAIISDACLSRSSCWTHLHHCLIVWSGTCNSSDMEENWLASAPIIVQLAVLPVIVRLSVSRIHLLTWIWWWARLLPFGM